MDWGGRESREKRWPPPFVMNELQRRRRYTEGITEQAADQHTRSQMFVTLKW
jgi:hypothetical protein